MTREKLVKIIVLCIFTFLLFIECLSMSIEETNIAQAYPYDGYYVYDYYDYSYDYFYGVAILELLIIICFFIWFFDLLFS